MFEKFFFTVKRGCFNGFIYQFKLLEFCFVDRSFNRFLCPHFRKQFMSFLSYLTQYQFNIEFEHLHFLKLFIGIKLQECDQELYKNFSLVISERWQSEVADTVFDTINHDYDKVRILLFTISKVLFFNL